MRKILIGIITLLLVVLTSVVLINGISIGNLKIESISQIKQKSRNLDDSLATVKELKESTYESDKKTLDDSAKQLELQKEKYSSKTATVADASTLTTVEVKTYKVEFLWTIIGNYATKNNTKLTLDIKNTQTTNQYDLDFTVTGEYIPITQFIYDIENDEDLKFQINNFNLQPYVEETNTTNNTTTNSTNTTTNTGTNKNNTNTNTTKTDTGKILQATFTVNNVGIELN